MKNFYIVFWVFFLIIYSTNAQQEEEIITKNEWLKHWTDFKPNLADNNEPTQILTGEIAEDIQLYKRETYLLLGHVFVKEGVTLTIEPGTVIIGDHETKASLTIAKGASIIADGLVTDPIVFTSNKSVKKPGDWGGIILLGDAPLNKFGRASVSSFYPELSPEYYKNTNYGGENVTSNSGILRFVRIEYAGKKTYTINSFSGLLLAGVGNETIVENVMVSYSAGESFKVWGGETNLKNMVSYRANGSDFNLNFGAQSQLLNSLAIRFPYISNSRGARCLDIRSYDKKDDIDFSKKGTSLVAENLTLVNNSKDFEFDIQSGLIKEGVYVGHNTLLNITKSMISGFKPAIVLEDEIQVDQPNLEKIKVTDMHFKNCRGYVFSKNDANNAALENWYANKEFLNMLSVGNRSKTFIADAKKAEIENKKAKNKVINKNIAIPFDLIELSPIFPGCERKEIGESKQCFQKKIRSHIANNFRYPEEALRNDIEGRVFIMFNIDSNGHVVNVKSRGPDKSLEEEAERMIKLLPKMQPGKQQGQTVKVSYGLPIAFKKTL
ncbi:energy transducer TonB [Flavivirga spongiicola]|uniref:Energy transducer TonB n=1 Tax=Flavivirga spongiicola TaxID=421621 RepID=A0ABU7XZ64_9FLAO|nr:energy transducer TonB [Flavivirga sp. MEBiC05379]MDO5980730.1 energy transducer TonB [Flavivirga sp. MEBiC05379]